MGNDRHRYVPGLIRSDEIVCASLAMHAYHMQPGSAMLLLWVSYMI